MDGLLLDASAWGRLLDPRLPRGRAAVAAEAFEAGRIVTCLPFMLEAGFSTPNSAHYDDVMAALLGLPEARIDDLVEGRALDAQRQLARVGHHRLPAIDLMIATLADRYGYGVLHYDGDYDTILAKTDLEFESVWLAERGTL
jgi:predicted nucleic acid-binding protein